MSLYRTAEYFDTVKQRLGASKVQGFARMVTSPSNGHDLDGAGTVPEVLEIAQRHKRDMTALLAGLLPVSAHRAQDAQALTLVLEGAIVRVQMGEPVAEVVAVVSRLTDGLVAAPLSCKR